MAQPRWSFKHVRLEALSYENEIRLLRRTRFLIALFGSALHNCRFLPADAVVLEVHGALKGERWGAHYYRDICQTQVGLKWAGHVVRGAHDRNARSPDYTNARLEPAELLRVVHGALDGNWTALAQEYEARLAQEDRYSEWRAKSNAVQSHAGVDGSE